MQIKEVQEIENQMRMANAEISLIMAVVLPCKTQFNTYFNLCKIIPEHY